MPQVGASICYDTGLRLSYEQKLQEPRNLLYIFNLSSSHHFQDKKHMAQEG
jgi:hypothetical protein